MQRGCPPPAASLGQEISAAFEEGGALFVAGPVDAGTEPQPAFHASHVAVSRRMEQPWGQQHFIQAQGQALRPEISTRHQQSDQHAAGRQRGCPGRRQKDGGQDGDRRGKEGCEEKEHGRGHRNAGALGDDRGGAADNAEDDEANSYDAAQQPAALPRGALAQLGAPAERLGLVRRIGGDDGGRAEKDLEDGAAQHGGGDAEEVGKLIVGRRRPRPARGARRGRRAAGWDF